MALWQVTSGMWDVPGNWQGAIPDGSGAIATFDSILEPHAGGNSALVTIPNGFSGGSVTLGRLEIITTAAGGTFFIRGSGVNTADVTLVMSSGSSEPASIFVDTNDHPNGAAIENGISGFKLLVSLQSNTNITTQNSDTKFEIASDISGGGEISKYGAGLLTLTGTNSFTGGLRLLGGTTAIDGDAALGSGAVTLRGGGLLTTSTGGVNNEFLVTSFSTGNRISAATGTELILSAPSFTMLDNSSLFFGSATATGRIVLAVGKANLGEITRIDVDGGEVTFADLYNAQNALRFAGDGLLQITPGGTLDTRGFAARVSNLDFDGGTLRSTTGALNLQVDYTNGQASNNGTIIATAGADQLVLVGKSSFNIDFSLTTFSGWSDTTDQIRFIGSNDPDNIVGTVQADRMFGNAGADTLVGGNGADLLNGQAGIDTTSGGLGDDTHVIDTASDIVIEADGQGNDLVQAGANFTLPSFVERLTLVGAAREGTGNGLDNTINGTGSNDTLLSGLDGADTINGQDGADIILGGNGEDLLIGGAAKDTLTGGADRDRFIFRDGDMNPNRAGADIITDFDQGLDERIVLTNVDADTALGGMQSLKFIGGAAFSGTAGELRFAQSGGNTFIEGNTDADLTPEFVIRLNGLYTLDITDFVGVVL